jgi:simple sugar transport system permease protein
MPDSKPVKVAFINEYRSLEASIYNQSAYEGLVRAAQENKAELLLVETPEGSSFEATLRELMAQSPAVVVTSGYEPGLIVEKVVKEYPDTRFIVTDYQSQSRAQNLATIVFAEDQMGFLAGALAGLMTLQNVVGFIGGMDVPAVRRLHKGFVHGVSYVNRRARVVHAYTDSFTDKDKSTESAHTLLKQRADVIFTAAGASSGVALITAAQQGAWVIGVDHDEWSFAFQDGSTPGAAKLLTSALKGITQAVFTIAGRALKGYFKSGVQYFDLSNSGVSLAPYHLADTSIPSEIRGQIREINDGLRAGTILTHVGAQGEDVRGNFIERIVTGNWQPFFIPALSFVTAMIIGAIFISGFDPVVWKAFSQGGLLAGLPAIWNSIAKAYGALFYGAFGSPVEIIQAAQIYFQTHDSSLLLKAIYPLTESLRISTPYVFSGLAVAIGFRAGLFNIGAEGQYFIGGLTSVYVGFSLTGFPWFIHLPLAIMAGMAGGAAWAAIAGYLKARTGAHEVINTMMLNYVAYRVADFLLQVGGPMSRPGDFRPISREILPTAFLPQFFPDATGIRVNWGIFLALATVFFMRWLLFKTTLGFEIRAVGANPNAARTAGINVRRITVLTMAISGALAGMSSAHDILGVIHYMPNAFSAGYGFDSIALALLGNSSPVGVLWAALLFGFMRSGAREMQSIARVPIDVISILQGLIIIFIAAPEIIRMIYRLRTLRQTSTAVVARGWSGS